MTWQVKSRHGEPNGSVLVDPDGNPNCANNPDGDHHELAENGPQLVV